MVFVTVGTHEQPFNRLIEYIDNLKKNGIIDEDVIMQTGYSTYKPKYCKWQKLYSYPSMLELVCDARVVITHGGPSSFIMPLQIGKIPVVVPRKKEFDEHVNNHQVDFCDQVAKRQGNIIVVEDISKLGDTIKSYDKFVGSMKSGLISNNERFCKNFEVIVEELVRRK